MAFPGATSTEGNGKRRAHARSVRRKDYAAGMREDSVTDNGR